MVVAISRAKLLLGSMRGVALYNSETVPLSWNRDVR